MERQRVRSISHILEECSQITGNDDEKPRTEGIISHDGLGRIPEDQR